MPTGKQAMKSQVTKQSAKMRPAAVSESFTAARTRQFQLTSHLANPFDLYGHLPFRLATVTNLLALDRDTAVRAASNLGLRELRLILNIGSYMPIRAADVAYQTRLDPFTVSRAVKTLLRRGLIEVQGDVRDRRSQLLTLSPAGRAEYRQITKVLAVRDRDLGRVLTAQERQHLNGLLARLEEFAEAMLVEHAEQMLQRGEKISADQRELIRWRTRSAAGR